MNRKGVLLVNLGTPDSPAPKDVYKYLIEFLTDARVIDYPWLKRQLLVRGIIVPARYKASAASYKAIWTEEGSPLMVYGQKVKQGLQKLLAGTHHVELAMRYQNPSIEKGIHSLLSQGVNDILVLPMFPQYASATTGSIHQKIMDIVKPLQTIPKLHFINSFPDHPSMIDAFVAIAKKYSLESYDHYLFSYHGLPERQLKKANPECKTTPNCCQTICSSNKNCYGAQCYITTKALINKLQLPQKKCSVSFQSRLGKEPWMQPYTGEVIKSLAQQGKERVLVFCPAFVCDCLETIFEISEEYGNEFKHYGGKSLDLVEGLNDHPLWLNALKDIVLENNP